MSLTVNASLCFQENANASFGTDGTCGLNYSGRYYNQSAFTGLVNLYDGNYTSQGYAPSGDSYLYINYTRPNSSVTIYAWMVVDATSPNPTYSNLTVYSGCVTNNTIQFRMQSHGTATTFLNHTCWDGSVWYQLRYLSGQRRIWEESIWWNIPDSNSCTYSSGNWIIQSKDYCNITSNVNLGGNNLTINGTGITTLTANVTGWKNIWLYGVSSISQAIVKCMNGGCFH